MMNERQCQAIWELIEDQRVSMLTWRCLEKIHSLPLRQTQKSFSGCLWFLLPDSDRYNNLPDDGEAVVMHYMNHQRQLFVILNGHSEKLQDPQLAKRLWSPGFGCRKDEDQEDSMPEILEVSVDEAMAWDLEENSLLTFYRDGG